jgi:integrase
MSDGVLYRPEITPETHERIISRAEARYREVLGDFAAWLRDGRGLAAGTIAVRLHLANRLLERVVGGSALEAALSRIDAPRLDDLFVDFGRELGYASLRNMRSTVRLFLRFAVDRGWVDPPLPSLVPRVATRRGMQVPRGFSDEQIALALSWLSGSSPGQIRDRAIFVLLAIYGVRRAQIAGLRLSDIDWKKRRIHFPAHKGGKPLLESLHPAAAASLARYIEQVRPRDCGPALFFRLRPKPLEPLRPGAISAMVMFRLEAAGIEDPKRGPHRFRHAFATRVLRSGGSLKDIADLLGHRHLDSASIYAKVDERGLREAALEWPEVLR